MLDVGLAARGIAEAFIIYRITPGLGTTQTPLPPANLQTFDNRRTPLMCFPLSPFHLASRLAFSQIGIGAGAVQDSDTLTGKRKPFGF